MSLPSPVAGAKTTPANEPAKNGRTRLISGRDISLTFPAMDGQQSDLFIPVQTG